VALGTRVLMDFAVTEVGWLRFEDVSMREKRTFEADEPVTYLAPFPLPGLDGGRRRTVTDVARGIMVLSSVYSISLDLLVF
jgi:hypothetical protein